MTDVTIRRALLSVSDKSGLADLGSRLAKADVELISTGGTARALREAGLDVRDVSDVTGFPEMMDGRVKTLHPAIHGGLLAVRDDPDHRAAMEAHDIGAIDLVIVNLYPFEETVMRGADRDTIIENIDIGGPSMLRSAAKNFESVWVIADPDDYNRVLAAIHADDDDQDLRRLLAQKVYAHTASYDAAIAAWFAQQREEKFPQTIVVSFDRAQSLRYGENPDQAAAFYAERPGAIRFYAEAERVPQTAVVPPDWAAAVVDERGRVERIPYELCVLRALFRTVALRPCPNLFVPLLLNRKIVRKGILPAFRHHQRGPHDSPRTVESGRVLVHHFGGDAEIGEPLPIDGDQYGITIHEQNWHADRFARAGVSFQRGNRFPVDPEWSGV